MDDCIAEYAESISEALDWAESTRDMNWNVVEKEVMETMLIELGQVPK